MYRYWLMLRVRLVQSRPFARMIRRLSVALRDPPGLSDPHQEGLPSSRKEVCRDTGCGDGSRGWENGRRGEGLSPRGYYSKQGSCHDASKDRACEFENGLVNEKTLRGVIASCVITVAWRKIIHPLGFL